MRPGPGEHHVILKLRCLSANLFIEGQFTGSLPKPLSPNIVFREISLPLLCNVQCLQGGVLRGVQDGAVRGEDPVADRGRLHGALVGPRQGGRSEPRLLPGGGEQVQITNPLTSSSVVFLDPKVLQNVELPFIMVTVMGQILASAQPRHTSASPLLLFCLPISSSISTFKMRCNAVDRRWTFWTIRPSGPWSTEV